MPKTVHKFLEKDYIPKTPPDAILIHPITILPILYGKSVVYYDSFLQNERISNNLSTHDFLKSELKAGKRVFIQETYECELIPYRCDKIKGVFDYIPYSKISPNNAFEIKEVILHKPLK